MAIPTFVEDEVIELCKYIRDGLGQRHWHWLDWHFAKFGFHNTAILIARKLVSCEQQCAGLGWQFADALIMLSGPVRNTDQYEQILQLLAEILVIENVLNLTWPIGTKFQYEPKGRTGKRPELAIRTRDAVHYIEVKAPSLLKHTAQRSVADQQFPGRIFGQAMMNRLAGEGQTVFPRDNPVKDFLVSAERKFSDFDVENGSNFLVIVWDDFIFEPITSLIGPNSGLLTENSFHTKDGKAIQFPSIDAVLVMRHLHNFRAGLAGHQLFDYRRDMFDLGDATSLPNLCIPTPWGRGYSREIADSLNCKDIGDPDWDKGSEYHAQDYVIWL